jgi:hypothetical protein
MSRSDKQRRLVAARLGEPVLALGFVRFRDGDFSALPSVAAIVVTEAKLRVFAVSRRIARGLGDEVIVWDRRSVRVLFDRKGTITRLTMAVPGQRRHLIVDVPRRADRALLHALAGGSVIAA